MVEALSPLADSPAQIPPMQMRSFSKVSMMP